MLTPEDEIKIRQIIEEMNNMTLHKQIFTNNLKIFDGKNLQVGRTNGCIIATEGGATGQKLGFFGKSAVVQPAKINDSSGDDATAVNAILDLLESLGLMRAS